MVGHLASRLLNLVREQARELFLSRQPLSQPPLLFRLLLLKPLPVSLLALLQLLQLQLLPHTTLSQATLEMPVVLGVRLHLHHLLPPQHVPQALPRCWPRSYMTSLVSGKMSLQLLPANWSRLCRRRPMVSPQLCCHAFGD